MQPFSHEELAQQRAHDIQAAAAEIRRGKLAQQSFNIRLATGRLLIVMGERLTRPALKPAHQIPSHDGC